MTRRRSPEDSNLWQQSSDKLSDTKDANLYEAHMIWDAMAENL